METVTMSRQAIELSFVLFAIVGSVFGYVLGRIHTPTQRKQPIKRHTKSHR